MTEPRLFDLQAIRLVSVLAVSLLAAACGGDVGSSLPTWPSGTATAGATISGVVNGMNSASRVEYGERQHREHDTCGYHVTVVGTALSTTVSGTGTFTLTGVPSGNIQLRFTACT